mmetsp:Transcript_20328/g.44019  ORF Transcript_20328/g.44019 Transcript_20328/m.44019 type:complete len:338 (-) Transcript_20328:92-1105(-)
MSLDCKLAPKHPPEIHIFSYLSSRHNSKINRTKMERTPLKSTSNANALSSAKKAVAGAKRELERVEAVLDALVGTNESSKLGTGPDPSICKRSAWPPDVEDKENSSSRCNEQKSNGFAKRGNLAFDVDKIKTITPKKARHLGSDMNSFARAIKGMSSNGGRKLNISRKSDGKGSDAKSPTIGQTEKVKLGKEVNDEEDVVFEVKARPYCFCPNDTDQDTFDGSSHAWTRSDAGTLRIYRHKITGKTRLVQRNRIGTVKLNVAIRDGMFCLEKIQMVVQRKLRKPVEMSHVQFLAVADKERGVEYFRLKTSSVKVDILFQQLKDMGAEVKRGTEFEAN